MGLLKKTSRPIRVDEVDYRWAESVTLLTEQTYQIKLTIESQLVLCQVDLDEFQ